jgi:hypothetical protein
MGERLFVDELGNRLLPAPNQTSLTKKSQSSNLYHLVSSLAFPMQPSIQIFYDITVKNITKSTRL